MLRSLSCLSFFFLLWLCSSSSFGQRIFWTEPGSGKIRVGTLLSTGGVTSASDYITLLNQPQNIALDVSSQRLFYTNNSTEDILVSSSDDASFISAVITTGAMAGFGAIVYSEDMDGIFTVNAQETDGVQFFPADNEDTGSGTGLDLSGNGGDIYSDVALSDAGAGSVYVVNSDLQRIFRTTDLTGDVATMLPSAPGVKHIAVDNLNSKIYYTVESGTTSIWSANLDGSSPQQIKGGITQEILSLKVYPRFNQVYAVLSGVGLYRMNSDGTSFGFVPGIGTGIQDFAIEEDAIAPGVNSLSPLDGAIDVAAIGTSLILTFNENVKISASTATGTEPSIRLIRTSDSFVQQTIDRSNASIFIAGNVVTITGISDLQYLTGYHVLIGTKVFSDLSNNNFAGISLATTWNFTTEEDQTKYYSRVPSGDFDALSTWTHDPSHSGPAVSILSTTGADFFIGNGHVVTLTGNTYLVPNATGLTIDAGGTLDMDGNILDIFNGDININGTLSRGGILQGLFTLNSTTGPPIFSEINCGATGYPGEVCNLATDVIALNGLNPIDGGDLQANGFDICNAAINPPPINTGFTNKKSTSVTLNWTSGATDAFIVARQGSTDFQPSFEVLYNSNTVFGSGDAVGAGNFVVYKGTANSVNITGLAANTDYEFDFYSYSTLVGGCYSIKNYHSAQALTTCTVLAAPVNPVNAIYCTGDVKPAITVSNPGSGRTINWYDAAVNGSVVTGDISGGAGRGEVFIPNAASGTFYAEIYDGTTQCSSDTRTAVTLTLNPIVNAGAATGTQMVCIGDDPTLISGGTATGGNGLYTYQWESATASTTGPYTDILGALGADYDPPAGIVLTTHYRRRVTSAPCTSQVGTFVTVTIGTPTNVTALTNTPSDAQITLNWTNPAACIDEILIIGKQGGIPVSTPVGDGTGYTANAVFGSGTAVVPGEFVMYKGTGTSVIVTGLTNSISYSFKVFTRKGLVWSTGAVTSGAGISTPPILTFNPTNGATNVALNSNITISFDEPVRNIDNSVIDNTNVGSLLAFKLTNSLGANVLFTATINGTKDMIIIDPSMALSPFQAYYLSVAPVEDGNGNASLASSITFTTQPGPTVTNVAPLSVCVGQSITITGTNFGTALPIVSINSVNIPVTAHSATSITAVPSNAASGLVTVRNMDLSLNAVSSSTVTITALPTVFNVTGGGMYCIGNISNIGVTIGLANSQSGVEYEVYLGASATGVKATPGGGAFNFAGLFTAAGTYSVKGKAAGSCSSDMAGTAIVTLNDIPSGTASIGSSTTAICENGSVTLTAQGFQNALTYVWALPAGLSTTSPTSGSTISVKGDAAPGGLVSVSARNDCGLSNAATVSITVNPLPVVTIGTPAAEEQILDDALPFTSEVDIPVASYAWDFGDGGSASDANTEHAFTSEGQFNISLIVKTAADCEGNADASVSITQFPTLSSAAIKNVITANDDGKNDRLIVADIDRFPNNTVSVLDRWGVEVHKQEAYNNDWDFKKGGNYLPAGSYICIVKLNDSGVVITRTVTLIRK